MPVETSISTAVSSSRCNINKLSTQYIAAIEAKLNDRPRKKLNFRTPKFVFYKKLK